MKCPTPYSHEVKNEWSYTSTPLLCIYEVSWGKSYLYYALKYWSILFNIYFIFFVIFINFKTTYLCLIRTFSHLEKLPSFAGRVQWWENHRKPLERTVSPTSSLVSLICRYRFGWTFEGLSHRRNRCQGHWDAARTYNTEDQTEYSVSTKSLRGFEKLWRANKLS
jgi:hypothetical protein